MESTRNDSLKGEDVVLIEEKKEDFLGLLVDYNGTRATIYTRRGFLKVRPIGAIKQEFIACFIIANCTRKTYQRKRTQVELIECDRIELADREPFFLEPTLIHRKHDNRIVIETVMSFELPNSVTSEYFGRHFIDISALNFAVCTRDQVVVELLCTGEMWSVLSVRRSILDRALTNEHVSHVAAAQRHNEKSLIADISSLWAVVAKIGDGTAILCPIEQSPLPGCILVRRELCDKYKSVVGRSKWISCGDVLRVSVVPISFSSFESVNVHGRVAEIHAYCKLARPEPFGRFDSPREVAHVCPTIEEHNNGTLKVWLLFATVNWDLKSFETEKFDGVDLSVRIRTAHGLNVLGDGRLLCKLRAIEKALRKSKYPEILFLLPCCVHTRLLISSDPSISLALDESDERFQDVDKFVSQVLQEATTLE